MRNFMLLLKVQLRNIFLRSTSQFSKKKKAVGLGFMAIPAGALLYMSCVYSFLLSDVFPLEYQYLVLYLMGFLSVLMLVIFGFQSAGGHLFGFKDYDLLMALPLTQTQILCSKFISFLLLEYFYSLFLIIPAMLVVAFVIHPGFMYFVNGLITVILLPLVPMVIAAFLAYLSMLIAGRFKYKNLMNNVLSMIFLGLIFVGSFSIQTLVNAQISTIIDIGQGIAKYFPFMTLLFDGMFGNYVHFALGIVLNIGIFLLFIWFFSRYFIKLNGQIKQGYKVKNFKLSQSKKQSSWMALFKKEARTYFSNATYLMNTLVFPLMMVAGSIYLVVMKDEILAAMPNYMRMIYFPLAIGIIILCSLTACTTNASISMEGQRIYLLKSLPIKANTLLSAKVMLNMVVVVPCGLIAILLAAFTFNFNVLEIVMLGLILIAATLFISLFGLILNLHYYRLDWENSVMVIKQSMPVFVTIFGGLILGSVILYIGMSMMDRSMLFAGICLAVFGAADLLLSLYLYKKGEQLFHKVG